MHEDGAPSSPLPLWERVARMSQRVGAERRPMINSTNSRRVRGLSPRIETPHPPSLREGTFSHKGRREGAVDAILSPHTGSAIEYFTWLNAKLDSIEAMPSSRVSLFFRNAS